jgi:hypothetical protein
MNRSLLFLALLLAGPAQAYVILESKYHVEVSPGVFDDQLILKCDNGRKLTVSWDARLSEVCGEVIIPRAAAAPSEGAGQQRQKEISTSRVHAQEGNVEENHVKVDAGADGAAPRFSPQMREILKRYELCRKHTKGSPSCAAERNQAMAALDAQPPGIAPAADTMPAAGSQAATNAKPTAASHRQAAKPAAKPNGTPAAHADAAPAVAEPEAGALDAAIEAAPVTKPEALAPAPDRTARAQKIAQDYTWCMRAKPKFDCDTQRAAALKTLDVPAKSKAKDKAAAAGKSADLATN